MSLKAEKGEAGGVCSRCGKCCSIMSFGMAYGGVDWGEFYAARGCHVEDGVGMIVPSVCPHLKYDEIAGHYSCDIYVNRPQLCRNKETVKKGLRIYRPPGCTR